MARWGVAKGPGWCSVGEEVGLARFAPAVLAWDAVGMGRSSMVVMSLKVVAMAAACGSQFLKVVL